MGHRSQECLWSGHQGKGWLGFMPLPPTGGMALLALVPRVWTEPSLPPQRASQELPTVPRKICSSFHCLQGQLLLCTVHMVIFITLRDLGWLWALMWTSDLYITTHTWLSNSSLIPATSQAPIGSYQVVTLRVGTCVCTLLAEQALSACAAPHPWCCWALAPRLAWGPMALVSTHKGLHIPLECAACLVDALLCQPHPALASSTMVLTGTEEKVPFWPRSQVVERLLVLPQWPQETILKAHSKKSKHFPGSGCPGLSMAIWLHALCHYKGKLSISPAWCWNSLFCWWKLCSFTLIIKRNSKLLMRGFAYKEKLGNRLCSQNEGWKEWVINHQRSDLVYYSSLLNFIFIQRGAGGWTKLMSRIRKQWEHFHQNEGLFLFPSPLHSEARGKFQGWRRDKGVVRSCSGL